MNNRQPIVQVGSRYLYRNSDLICQVVSREGKYYTLKILRKGTSGFTQGDVEGGFEYSWFYDMVRLPDFNDYLKAIEG